MDSNTSKAHVSVGQIALQTLIAPPDSILVPRPAPALPVQQATVFDPSHMQPAPIPARVLTSFNLQDRTVTILAAPSRKRPNLLSMFYRLYAMRPLGQLVLIVSLALIITIPAAGFGIVRYLGHTHSASVTKPAPAFHKAAPQPTTPVTAPVTPASTPAPAPSPAPKPAPAHTPPPTPAPAPLPTLPVVSGKDTSYNLGVLVIKYFPLTADGQNININVTGDVGDPYSVIHQKTIDITNNLLSDLSKGTEYLGYNHNDPPALTYHVVATYEHNVAVPINSTLHPGYVTYPDYYGIMSSHNICNYVDDQGVREVWLFAYQGPNQPSKNNQPYLGIEESKMSGPYGDISNSYEWNDMPKCSHTCCIHLQLWPRYSGSHALMGPSN